MSKVKILTIAVLVLVILNLGMIAFCKIVKQKEFGMGSGGPKQMIVNKLHFDEQQQKDLDALVTIHKNKIDVIDQEIKIVKENLFAELAATQINQKIKDSLVTILGEEQKKIENAHFEHFQKIQAICNTPEQQENFKNLAKELGKIFSKHRMQHRDASKTAK